MEDPSTFWFSQKINCKEDVHRLTKDDWTKSPTEENDWKQMMVHARLTLTTPKGETKTIDVFASHNKSGEDPKDFPKKIAQARFLAREVKNVKTKDPETHVFVCSDFNTDMKNDVAEQDYEYDTYSRLERELNESDEGEAKFDEDWMTSAYKDVYGEHLPWTCVKTRDWMNYVAKVPNQPEKVGGTANCIDLMMHCNRSLVLWASDLRVNGIEPEDYWKSFPSKHAFSDHGKPLLCEYALLPKNKYENKELEQTKEIKQIIADMKKVEVETAKKNVEIKCKVVMREFVN